VISRVRKEIAMKSFAGKIAVITGGGSGMGRELALQLAAMGCDVAMCDVSAEPPSPVKAGWVVMFLICSG
jgi:NAD(P)-dependent dehydrogenase (short-subunit alcohol dehydrogenase family)